MKRGGPPPEALLEWGPSHATAVDVATGKRKTGQDVEEAALVLNGHRDVVATLSRRTAFVKAVRVPDAPREEVAQILALQMGQLFPVPGESLAFDFMLTEDRNADGRLAIVTAVRESDLKALNDQATARGLKLRRVVPAAFGSAALAGSLGIANAAVVNSTPEGTAIDIITEGSLRYSRVVPAETPEAIMREIDRTLAASGVSSATVVAAGGLKLPGAIEANESPLNTFATPFADSLPLHLETSDVLQARRRKQEQRKVRQSVLLCLAALTLVVGVSLDRGDAEAKIRAEEAKASTRAAQLRKVRDGVETRARDVQGLATTVQRSFLPAQPVSDVMMLITQLAPSEVWLTGFTMERGKPIIIRGTATQNASVAKFLETLNGQQRFRDVKLVFANNGEIEDTPVVDFSISAFPVGNLPLAEAKKGRGARR